MEKTLRIILYVFIAFTFLGWNNDILPSRVEINQLELARILGLDSADGGTVTLSALINTEKKSSEAKDSSEGSTTEKLVSVTAGSFVKCANALQNATDKKIPGGHVSFVILGENAAQSGLTNMTEFVLRDNELRLNSAIYIAKNSTAESFFKNGTGKDVKLVDRIEDIGSSSNRESGISEPVKLLDMVKLVLSKEKSGVIPAMALVSDNNSDGKEWTIDLHDQKPPIRIEFVGYGIIKQGKLIGYLDTSESYGYDVVRDILKVRDIIVKRDIATVTLTLIKANRSINFDFDGDKLKKVRIRYSFNSNITEVSNGEDIFLHKEEIEKMQSDIVKGDVEKVIRRAKDENADFLGIGQELKLKHPYKWQNIEKEWDKIFSKVEFEVEVDSKVRRTYDIFSLEKEED